MTNHTKHQPCNVLILTGSIGSGHVSVAHAIEEALRRTAGKKCSVETIDFVSSSNFVTNATKTFYLNSLKISPRIWEMIFNHSSDSDLPLKFLNAISAPFLQQKFLELIEEKKPSVLVSTFPVWDILIKKSWEKYSGGKLPFVSVITDSISVHNAWTIGNPDYFFVSNEDTKVSLKNLGIPEEKILAFGYPVSRKFCACKPQTDFYEHFQLSPKKRTLLLILSTGMNWAKVKKIAQKLQETKLKNIQVAIINAANKRWTEKLSKMKWPIGKRITGWTNEMHKFIHGSDIILTKAGGATVVECIESKKPMIIIDVIPGQEIGNAMLVQKYNLGVVLNKDLDNFDTAIEYIFNNQGLIEKNLESQRRPEAADDIAKFLINLCKLTKT